MAKITIGLWRKNPPHQPLNKKSSQYPIDRIFPSGRQALSYAIKQVGLIRPNRVSIPEWSSHCVISTIGLNCTPIPINEVIKFNIRVSALLLYEQWGWPFPPSIKADILKKFMNTIIIFDRVDSVDISNENRMVFYPEVEQIELISLSKNLGLIGGGIAKLNGKYLKFKSAKNEEALSTSIWKNNIIENYVKLIDIHKSYIECLHPKLKNWLKNNDLDEALAIEYKKRKQNLSRIINCSLSSEWPEWMINVFKNGAGPMIAPLFRNQSRKILEEKQNFLEKIYGIETTLYHFNWTGNPLNPSYENVLAFPIHGGITEQLPVLIEELLEFDKSM